MTLHSEYSLPADTGESIAWNGLSGAHIGLALTQAIEESAHPVLIITPDTSTANRLLEELHFFKSPDAAYPVLFFPDWETLPYDVFSPHHDIISERIHALFCATTLKKGALIAPISTLMCRLTPPDFLDSTVFLLKKGDVFDRDLMRQRLQRSGYRCVETVREQGEFSVRGALFDVFPTGCETPYRLDLFDAEIDSIHTFLPDTQHSIKEVNDIALLPAKEFPLHTHALTLFKQRWATYFESNPQYCSLYQDILQGIAAPGIEYYLPLFFEKTATIFDYLPNDALVIHVGAIHDKALLYWQEISARYTQRVNNITRPLLPPQDIFIPVPDLFQQIRRYAQIKISMNDHYVSPVQKGKMNALNQFIKDDTGRALFCAETAGRREVLLSLLNTIPVHPTAFLSWHDFIADKAQYGITVASLDSGLQLTNLSITLITESELLGERTTPKRRQKGLIIEQDALIKDLTELTIGAPIVHLEQGIGRFIGLQTLEINDQIAEFLTIEYADNNKLYVPVASLHLISRYSGANPEQAPLHKLGTEQWQRAKKKAAEEIEDVAAGLLDIYAKREARVGFQYDKMLDQYAAFAASFPFETTPDQQKAINEVIADMASTKPMDRLVCGDVGFGKTEVAIRAAFIAAQNNKQVAVLVPTTLLAQQHYHSFQDRFADWPIRIGVLSRFQSKQEQRTTLTQLTEGKIDIVIGTHKILQKDVIFKDLGLAIIDEEHRFGVQQKEKLKTLRSEVDILTLTATPIPRTLNMAFASIRDLSLITTPPARRLSIKTFIEEKEENLLQEAISRELLRGGQVYFIHNEVANIEKMVADIARLVPFARVGFAHGQMNETALEEIMSDFYHRRFNVLVCTTIVESGIDIPSANTIIINRADKFGLAQLHQLRGRVGRSHHQAYAYLLVPSRELLAADALKRLDAITSLEELGAGFMLATHDLEIRGAGELLGKNQSGQMMAIGFTLYMDLLSQAVSALKSGQSIEWNTIGSKGTDIECHIPSLIPSQYIGDVNLRLQYYKRIASADTSLALDHIIIELIDRFGLLPIPLKNLLAIRELKQIAEKIGILKIEAHNNYGKIEFTTKPNIDPRHIIHLIQNKSATFRLENPTRLRFALPTHPPEERIEWIKKILKEVAPGATL